MTTKSGAKADTGSGSPSLSLRDWYEVTGDVHAALELLHVRRAEGRSSATDAYNQCLLEQALVASRKDSASKDDNNDNVDPQKEWSSFLQRLGTLQNAVLVEASTDPHNNNTTKANAANNVPTTAKQSRKRKRVEWIVTYNHGLALWTSGQAQRCIELVWPHVEPLVMEGASSRTQFSATTPTTISTSPPSKMVLSKELIAIACRLAFLWLEGVLSLSVGNPHGCCDYATMLPSVLEWLTKSAEEVVEESPEVKFLLALYMARLGFLERSDYKLVDAKIRAARKELKQAMEIFQHKLRTTTPSTGVDGISVASSGGLTPSNNSNNNSNIISTSNIHQVTNDGVGDGQHQREQPLSRVLQKQNQAALNLKANTEQLKGNMKKSLILLAEAQDGEKDALHYNNLAIVYATHGKAHLALHAWSKALQHAQPAQLLEDGTVLPPIICQILHNAGWGALRARNFLSAYECFGTCLQRSRIWSSRPRTWLRLAEACIGLLANAKARNEKQTPRFRHISDNGSIVAPPTYSNDDSNCDTENGDGKADESGPPTKGILLFQGPEPFPSSSTVTLSPVLASPEDLEQVQSNPLPRARASLEYALELYKTASSSRDNTSEEISGKDDMFLVSTQLSLAFLCLEDQDYDAALDYSKSVIEFETSPASTQKDGDNQADMARRTLLERQQATARMYAAEASCAMGNTIASMRHLVGEGKDDAFDRLASALSGVTLEKAALNPRGKARLAKAQAMVRCSASAAYAHSGNISAAKQLAMSAQAMEDAYSSSREGSSARRALLYCMLRDGNSGAALSLLRSAR